MMELKAIESSTAVIGNVQLVYIKEDADKVFADLEESHKKEVEQLLMEIVKKNKWIAYAKVLLFEDIKIIRNNKNKRCLGKAEWCESKVYHIRRTPLSEMSEHEYWQYENDFWQRWHKRWLKLAEKFKEDV